MSRNRTCSEFVCAGGALLLIILPSLLPSGVVDMAVKKILLLGHPKLHEVSNEIDKSELPFIEQTVVNLHDTMMDFRDRYGAGRAIAAPQIGVMKRLIYMNIHEPVVLINPTLSAMSDEMIEFWDDCMSFPDLIVRVRRHKSCTISFRDLEWNDRALELSGDLSELIQHEYDHLDGVLAVSRAIDGQSFALISQMTRVNNMWVRKVER